MSILSALEDFLYWARGQAREIQTDVTGNIEETFQAIIDIKEMDCGGDWILYIKTAINPLGNALYLLIIPSFEEILESYLEPKAGRRGARRGRRGERERRVGPRGGSRVFFGGRIPDVDNLIADRLPGRGFFAGRVVGPGEHLFWTTVRVADAFRWWFLVVEASTVFTTMWSSGLMRSGQCQGLSVAAVKVITPITQVWGNTVAWENPATLLEAYVEGMILGDAGDAHLLPNGYTGKGFCFAEVTFGLITGTLTAPTTMEVGFRIDAFNSANVREIILAQTVQVSIDSNGYAAPVISGHIDFHDRTAVVFLFTSKVISGGGVITNTAQGKFAANFQEVHVV